MKIKVKLAFEPEGVVLGLDQILPLHPIKLSNNKPPSGKYGSILSSIKEQRIVEPLIVHPQKGTDKYLLLDGHQRYAALKELGMIEAFCLIATDDEAFTFNQRVSRLAPIQENTMIQKALQNGVSEERIALVLNMPLSRLRANRDMLDGIHTDAVDLLKETSITPNVIRMLRKVNAVRQAEIAQAMVDANTFTHWYAKALVGSSKKEHLIQSEKPKRKTLKPEELIRLERETINLEQDFKVAKESLGENRLNLKVASRYLSTLFKNTAITKYLRKNHMDVYTELQSIVESELATD